VGRLEAPEISGLGAVTATFINGLYSCPGATRQLTGVRGLSATTEATINDAVVIRAQETGASAVKGKLEAVVEADFAASVTTVRDAVLVKVAAGEPYGTVATKAAYAAGVVDADLSAAAGKVTAAAPTVSGFKAEEQAAPSAAATSSAVSTALSGLALFGAAVMF